jgi:maltose O-acetyltransferase
VKIKKIITKLFYPNKFSSDAYVNYLRARGAKIGDCTYFFDPKSTLVDESRPEFIEIGKCCKITSGVKILAHDYSYSVLRPIYHEMLPTTGITKIGNNVFIGMNAIILMNTTIGDNCIIGAGAIVNGNVESGTIYAGNPAKQISTIDKYYKKIKKTVVLNAKMHARRIKEIKGRNPSLDEMGYYSWIFCNNDDEQEKVHLKKFPFDGDIYREAFSDYVKQQSVYESFNDFLKNI